MLLLIELTDILGKILLESESFAKDSYIKKADRLMVNSMVEISEHLLTVPEETIYRITDIMVINLFGEYLIYDDRMNKKFIQRLKGKSGIDTHIKQLFNEAKLYNLNGTQGEIDFIKKFNLETKNKEFIFFDTLLTNFIVLNLIESRRQGKLNIIGYRFLLNDENGSWSYIEDAFKYLNFAFLLYIRFITSSSYYKHGKIESMDRLIKGDVSFLIYQMEKAKGIINICYFQNDEEESLDKFTDILKEKFEYSVCDSKKFNPPPTANNLIILGFGKLTEPQQRNLLKELSEDRYKDSRIIIISNKIHKSDDTLKTVFWPGLSVNKTQDFMTGSEEYAKLIDQLCDQQIAEYKYVLEKLIENPRQRKGLIKKLENYFIGDEFYKADKVDFLYDAPEKFFDEKKLFKSTDEIWEQYFALQEKTKFYFSRDKQDWIIRLNEEETIRVSLKSRPIRFILFLYKHYSDGSSIKYSELIKVILEWEEKDNIKQRKSPETSLAMSKSLSSFYINRPKLNLFQKCVMISSLKDVGCYFHNIREIEIELDDFYIPEVN